MNNCLIDNDVFSRILKGLSKNSSLTDLYLIRNKISDNGVKELINLIEYTNLTFETVMIYENSNIENFYNLRK